MIRVKLLYENAKVPKRATPGSAAYDLYCVAAFILDGQNSLQIVQTGVSLEDTSSKYWYQILCRSSLAAKGVSVRGGVIDNDYRGEIKVILFHSGQDSIHFKAGDRVAQLVVHEMCTPTFQEVTEDLGTTERGQGGFGSTNNKRKSETF